MRSATRRRRAGRRSPGARAARHCPRCCAARARGAASSRSRGPSARSPPSSARATVDAGHRHLGLDAGDRRAARPAERRRDGGAHARRHAAARLPPRPGLLRLEAEQLVEPTTDRGSVLRALDGARGPRRDRDGRRPRSSGSTRRSCPSTTGSAAAAPAARRARAALRRREHARQPTRSTSRSARSGRRPVYTIALGTPDGELVTTAPDGTVEREPVPPDTRRCRRSRARPAGATSTRRTAATSSRSTRASARACPRAPSSRR